MTKSTTSDSTDDPKLLNESDRLLSPIWTIYMMYSINFL